MTVQETVATHFAVVRPRASSRTVDRGIALVGASGLSVPARDISVERSNDDAMASAVLITGCSSGIGRATARAFLADGWDVWATARDPDEIDGLAERGAETARLDVTSDEGVERVVDRLVTDRGRVDCLVNVAGFGQLGPVEDVPVDQVIEQYDANTFGPHRLMRAVLPHMRERRSGTIVNVTSMNDRLPFAGTGVYSGSKSALATTTQTVRQEVHGTGVDVVIVEPSFVATAFYDRMTAELADLDRTPAYADLYELLADLRAVESGGPGIASPEAVAETIVEAADSDDPKRRYEVGTPARIGRVVAAVVPESWRTPALRASVRLATSGPALRLLRWWESR